MQNEKYTRIIFLNAKGLNHRITSNYRRLPQVSEKLCDRNNALLQEKKEVYMQRKIIIYSCVRKHSQFMKRNIRNKTTLI